MSLPSGVNDIIRQLTVKYQAQLPEKFAQIDALWEEIQSASVPDQEKVQNLHRLVHSMTGSGATFGLSELSVTARVLEASLKALGQQAYALTELAVQQISEQWQAVKASVLKPDTDVYEILPVAEPLQMNHGHRVTVRDGGRVLLVEDDPVQAQNISMQLGCYGYEIQVLTDVTRLLETVKEVGPAVLVINVIHANDAMTGPSRYAALPVEVRQSFPAIFISAVDNLDMRLQSVRAGGVAYLAKPLDIGMLVDKIDAVVFEKETEPYRILVVDDSPELSEFFSHALQDAGMEAFVVTDPLKILDAMSEFNPELILLDMYMPGCNGPDLAGVVRQQEAYVSTPIVFLSAEMDVDKQLAAMQLGADDFLTKPISAQHLVASVTARVKRSRVLRSYMVRDSLTGLFNHTKTKERLDFEMSRATRQHSPLAFAMLDIDHFKQVNDTYGHPAGDRVIKSLSRLLQQRLRKTDIIGRYGGEEFAIVFTDTDGEMALNILNEIRHGFEQTQHQFADVGFSVKLSGGLAVYPMFKTSLDISNAADRALYEAKRLGRNRIVMMQAE